MSLAADLHQAHKERLARIDRAIAHRQTCAKAAEESAKDASLEKTALPKLQPAPSLRSGKLWFCFVDESDHQPKRYLVSDIQGATCQYFGITQIELLSRRRSHDVVIPRQIAMYLCKQLTTRSLPEIGRMFGGMDHTTVLNAVRVIEKRMSKDWRLAFDIAHVERTMA